MSEVRGHLPTGRAVDAGDFADLTSVAVTDIAWGENGEAVVTFEADLTGPERAAVLRRILSRSPREELLREDAEAYLLEASPDLAELRTQVERLTEIVVGRTLD